MRVGIRRWRAPVVVVATVGRTLLLVWDVSAAQEEPWRRLLQELSYARCEEEYVESRRRLGVSAESVWLVPKRSGGGIAVVYLEVLDPERALGELAASEAPFDSWYSRAMRQLFGFDLARLTRAASCELFLHGAMVVRASVRRRINS
jgi:hypothetical protein